MPVFRRWMVATWLSRLRSKVVIYPGLSIGTTRRCSLGKKLIYATSPITPNLTHDGFDLLHPRRSFEMFEPLREMNCHNNLTNNAGAAQEYPGVIQKNHADSKQQNERTEGPARSRSANPESRARTPSLFQAAVCALRLSKSFDAQRFRLRIDHRGCQLTF